MATAGGYASANAATKPKCITKISPLAVCSPVAVCPKEGSLVLKISQSSNNIYMNNERPTPETDAHMLGGSYSFDGEFARKLERQRDEALKQCVELKAMREAIKDAHGAISQCLKYILKLPLSGSDAECEVMDDAHHALRKLKPFIND